MYNVVSYNKFGKNVSFEFFSVSSSERYGFVTTFSHALRDTDQQIRYDNLNCNFQQIITCSKSTNEAVEKVMKYVQSQS